MRLGSRGREWESGIAPGLLPLHNASGDGKLDYLGSGCTEALTNDLAEMPGLQVKAAGIAERYPSNDPSEAGRRLHVKSVLSGSFFEAGGHVRIPIEIIDVSSGSQIWGKNYEGDMSDLAGLQNEISTDVAYHLKVRLNPDLKPDSNASTQPTRQPITRI